MHCIKSPRLAFLITSFSFHKLQLNEQLLIQRSENQMKISLVYTLMNIACSCFKIIFPPWLYFCKLLWIYKVILSSIGILCCPFGWQEMILNYFITSNLKGMLWIQRLFNMGSVIYEWTEKLWVNYIKNKEKSSQENTPEVEDKNSFILKLTIYLIILV